jgi:hypothetical protein
LRNFQPVFCHGESIVCLAAFPRGALWSLAWFLGILEFVSPHNVQDFTVLPQSCPHAGRNLNFCGGQTWRNFLVEIQRLIPKGMNP